MKYLLKKGTTSFIAYVSIDDSSSTTGAKLTGLAYNTPGSPTMYYVRQGAAAATPGALATQTVTGAYSSNGFVEVDATNMPGVYRFDVPDAVLATGVEKAVVVLKGWTNAVPVHMEFQLTDYATFDTNVAAIGGTVANATNLASSAGAMAIGTVDTAGFSPTTTAFETSSITTAAADHWVGRAVIWTSGTLQYQVGRITAYSLASGRGHFTITTQTSAPANAVTFVIV
jgi:hypothetical protein